MNKKAKVSILVLMTLAIATAAHAATWTVTKTADTNDGVCNADCSLREAIAAAASGDEIVFSALFNTPQSIELTSTLVIRKNLTISGTGSRNVTLTRPSDGLRHGILDVASSPSIVVTIRSLSITNGRVGTFGGGVFVGNAHLTLDSVSIRNNVVEVCTTCYGAGIYVSNTSTLVMTNSSVSGNDGGGKGGGIANRGTTYVSNSTLSGNSAYSGGGVYTDGTLVLNNVTITQNHGELVGGGIYADTAGLVRNSIIAGNTADLAGPDINGSGTSLGNNLVGNSDQSSGFINGIIGDKVGSPSAPLNPQLGNLQSNGGPTDTHAPAPTSPAVNAGNICVINSNCTSHNPPVALTNDQRGPGFPRRGGATVDMGAVELPVVPVITSLSPPVRGLNTGAFVLTVHGSGFVGNSTVRWNGSNRATTFVSPNQLTAQIPATDVQAIQTVPVTVFTPAPGGGTSSTANFNITSCVSLNSPAPLIVAVAGGTFVVNVSGTNGCPWTATTTASWITGLPANGAGDGPFSFTVQGNSGAARSATIRIRIPTTGVEVNLTVNQSGCGYALASHSATVPASAGLGNFQVVTNPTCTWTAVSNNSFLTITQGSSGTGNGVVVVSISANTGPARTGTITAAGLTFTFNQLAGSTGRRSPFDFDGDNKTDIGIFRPAAGEWWIQRSSTGVTFAAQFGAPTDRIVPGDLTGDGKADIAVWRPASGTWFVLRSENFSYYSFEFGLNGDVPSPADYDKDGKTDPAVFRPSNGTWYIQRSSGGYQIEQFGINGDIPVASDYDGDGKADLAIYRPSNGQWWLKRTTAGVIAATFGTSTDRVTPGDFTGDGKTDVAIWRPSSGEWFVLRSEDFSYYSLAFGTNGDIPAAGDYDGDGKTDTTVFRPSNATWYVQRSTGGFIIQQYGATSDRPLPSAYVP